MQRGEHKTKLHRGAWLAGLIIAFALVILALLELCNFPLLHNSKLDSINTNLSDSAHQTDGEKEDSTKIEYVPVIQVIANVWIVELTETEAILYQDGEEIHYPYYCVEDTIFVPDLSIKGEVANVTLTDACVSDIEVLSERLQGVVLGADETGIEVQGMGRIPLADNYKGYYVTVSQLNESNQVISKQEIVSMCAYTDLAFGYDFADFILKEGEICGILIQSDLDHSIMNQAIMTNIRVLLKNDDFADIKHEKVIISCNEDYVVTAGESERFKHAGQKIEIKPNSELFQYGRIRITPKSTKGKLKLESLTRNQGTPSYKGVLELIQEGDGIVVINELPLEEYLYSVVPSEMPSSYSLEALKAQAICARTYGYLHMLHAAYPKFGAHVDDSTSFQVYNNILAQDSTTRAVTETEGQLLFVEEKLAETYYYSTSCGIGSDVDVWKNDTAQSIDYLKTELICEDITHSEYEIPTDCSIAEYLQEEEHFEAFIRSKCSADFEYGESFYRWKMSNIKVNVDRMNEVLAKRFRAKPESILTKEENAFVSIEPKPFKKVKDLSIAKRGLGGVADELILETDVATYKVLTEYNIRAVLCDGSTKVTLANGKTAEMPNLLPSAFFIMDTSKKKGNVVGYSLIGGGFGHGVGMSQNAAKNMAKAGYTCEEILRQFYRDCEVQSIY